MRENQMDMNNAAGIPFGKIIRDHRKQVGLSQEQLGALVRVKKNAVGAWEAGRSRPDVGSIPILCRALGMTLEEFFGTTRMGTLHEDGEVVYDSLPETEEDRMLARYRLLNEYNRKVVHRQVDTLFDLQANS